MDDRKTFLLKMYDQMFADIDRHIMVVWQSIGVIGGAAALLALAEKGLLAVDFAVALIVVVCFWSLNTIIESAYWYNRNLVIIANIERQFLNESDLKDVHFYFGKHRAPKIIVHLRIQLILVLLVLGVFLVYHFCNSLLPSWRSGSYPFQMFLPWILFTIGVGFAIWIYFDRKNAYQKFLQYSPGREIKSDIPSVPGHRTE